MWKEQRNISARLRSEAYRERVHRDERDGTGTGAPSREQRRRNAGPDVTGPHALRASDEPDAFR